jgi:hypothetical protein
VADDQHRLAVDAGQAADDGGVVADAAVAVNLAEAFKEQADM